MTAIGTALGGLVTLTIGISLVFLLMGVPWRETKKRITTTVCLGLAVGLVVTSCAHFLWQELFSNAPLTFLWVDVGLLLAMGFAFALRRAHPTSVDFPIDAQPAAQPTVAVLLLVAASLAAVLNSGAFVLHQLTGSAGGWDAVGIWNLKARFLLRAGPHWADAIDPLLLQSHPDYPLLLPLSVARLWRYAGGTDSTLVPVIAAAVFTAASVALLGAGVAQLRGRAQGLLAALSLLAMPYFFEVGAWQYADVPMAFFELATLVCAMLAYRQEETSGPRDDRARGTWAVAGLCAGAALWTKNEGALFVAAFLVAACASGLFEKHAGRMLQRLTSISLGLLPAVSALVAFKLKHPFPNDIVGSFDRTTLGHVFNPGRHLAVWYDLRREVSASPDRIPTLLVLAYGIATLAQVGRHGPPLRASERAALAASTLSLVVLAAGLYSTFLITPYPIDWQINRSAHRLWLQLLPSVLFVIFVYLPPAESVLGWSRR